MSLPLFKALRAGPPPPKVILLPDGMFFTRSIPIAAGSTQADVAGQVDLALETLSPFPAAQLYHGFYRPAGSDRVLVFAAYRRRFTAEQMTGWEEAELVLPTFVSMLGGVTGRTTMIIPSHDGLTAVYWEDAAVPTKIVFRALAPDATDADRARARDGLLAAMPNNQPIVLHAAPTVEKSATDVGFDFRSGSYTSRLPAALAGGVDVRDKEALTTLRRARGRDNMLWRVFMGTVVLLVLLGLAEFGLVGASVWQKARLAQINAQRPVVEKIMMAQGVTTRINDLSTKRLLPFEMIQIAMGPRPASVQFLRASTVGLYGLNVEAQTTTPTAPSAYQAGLAALPAVEKVEVRDQRARDNLITFTLAVTYKPESVKAGEIQ